jgi:HEPN domain
MPEYNISFGEKLVEVANLVVADGLDDPESKRVVLYLSLLSTEISLKAMLEKSGKPVKKTHDLAKLLGELALCKVEVEIYGTTRFDTASRLRACTLSEGEGEITVGKLIDECKNASQYPNNIRYGNKLKHFPPTVVAQMASVVAAFARKHWETFS